MKKFFAFILALALSIPAFSQASTIPQRLELVEIEINDGEEIISVVNFPSEGSNHYYLAIGRPGIGNRIIQLQVDPVSELFVALGDNLSEALLRLQELQKLFKSDPGTSIEMDGVLSILSPGGKPVEPVTVTYIRPLLGRKLQFSVQREGYTRAAYISKMELGSLVTSVKMYSKLHPKER